MASHISEGRTDLIFGEPTEHEGSMTLRNFVKTTHSTLPKNTVRLFNHLSDSITTVGLTECDAVLSGKLLQRFRSNLLLSFLDLNTYGWLQRF